METENTQQKCNISYKNVTPGNGLPSENNTVSVSTGFIGVAYM